MNSGDVHSSSIKSEGRTRSEVSTICPLDCAFEIFGEVPLVVPSLVLATIAYTLAVTPLVVVGEFDRMLNVPFGIGFIGFVWVLVTVRSVTRNYLKTLEKVRLVVSQGCVHLYDALVDSHVSRLRDWRHYLRWCSLIWCIAAVIMAGNWYGLVHGKYLDFFVFMPLDWYQAPGIFPRYLSLALLFAPIVILTYTPGRLMVLHTIFVCQVSRLDFLPSPRVCGQHMRELMTVGIVASLTWSVGIGLFAFLFKARLTVLHVAFLMLLATVGTSVFFIPLYAVRRALLRISEKRNRWLMDEIVSELCREPESRVDFLKVTEYEKNLIRRGQVNELLVGWKMIGTVSASALIPAITSYVQPHITALLGMGVTP